MKKAKNRAILNDSAIPVQKATQVLEIPSSDYIGCGIIPPALKGYDIKSITMIKGRNTVIEIFK